MLGQAIGGYTEKLKFGHHGINQPVKNLRTGRIEITSQNHGFVVVPASVDKKASNTHINLNDNTSEGLQMLNTISVQYHPEAAPGPHDSEYLFLQFVQMMKEQKEKAS
jgi:carbamoyl-phosphate synthase small subunit